MMATEMVVEWKGNEPVTVHMYCFGIHLKEISTLFTTSQPCDYLCVYTAKKL